MSTPSFPDLVSVAVVWWAENVNKVASTQHNRVAPGGLTLLTPTSMFDWYQEFQAIYKYTYKPQFYSDMTLHLFLLIWCSLYQTSAGYCYSNVFADVSLNNGIN